MNATRNKNSIPPPVTVKTKYQKPVVITFGSIKKLTQRHGRVTVDSVHGKRNIMSDGNLPPL